ncbi:benzoylformate decarboxylase [Occallatibacter riparius]|uniref:Benzoylformate decarboxylase n=1 Tax=Occallatibacter riparius TaxID=1002689 RepID=A0A9J7BVY7_9BACT|nr:benzoylformate decarboxylase [Occallatibacter riparius]UWZ85173.1 benzoylformate decarboxylase [Occallatibacter riparius]
MTADKQQTVWAATYDLLRTLGLTTVFGNPGSTEQPFLKNFPPDFEYILGLQEASAVAMADGFAQATGKPALVNLHTSAGTGNGMGNIMTAFQNKTPLIITAGQQTREMIICDPLLTNRDETMLPRPYVKWSYEPKRAEDVPRAIMRAYALALQPPAGPVYVSIPLDDWDKTALGAADIRTVSDRIGPDPERLKEFAERINRAKNPVLVYGAEVEKAGAWRVGVAIAEKLRVPVYRAPAAERACFPETHPLFQGELPAAIGPLSSRLVGHDLIVVVGAPVFRYYPYVPGPILPEGASLLQITTDPTDAGSALVGDSLLSDVKLALDGLLPLVHDVSRNAPEPRPRPKELTAVSGTPLTANELYAVLSEVRPDGAIVVQESPSNYNEFLHWWPTTEEGSYFTYASGGLGHNAPSSVGVALAQRKLGTNRPVVVLIGDGSLQYSVQSLSAAAQHKLKMVYIVPCNGEYAILKEFAVLEKTPNVPSLDLPFLDIVSLAKGYGCNATKAETKEEIQHAFKEALAAEGPTVIAIPIKRELKSLIPSASK